MSGDEELERFCAEAFPRLVAALTHQFGDRWLAEELAQEALIRACDHWPKVGHMNAPVGWAFHVGANLGKSRMRRRAAARRARARAGPDPGIHRDVDAADQVAVRQALDTLTDSQREAVVLRYYLGLSAEQAADLVDSTPGAVRGLTFRAVRAMRDALDVDLDDEEISDVS